VETDTGEDCTDPRSSVTIDCTKRQYPIPDHAERCISVATTSLVLTALSSS